MGHFGKIENATIAVISKNIELITVGIPKMVEIGYIRSYDVISGHIRSYDVISGHMRLYEVK